MDEILCIWRWCGLFPHVRTSKGYYTLSFRLFLLSSVIAIAGPMGLVYFHLNRDYTSFPTVSLANLIAGRVMACILPLHTFYLICSASPQIIALLDRLEQVDKCLKWNGFVFKRVTHCRRRYLLYTCYFCTNISYQFFATGELLMSVIYAVSRMGWVSCVLHLIDHLDIFSSYFAIINELTERRCYYKQLECLTACHYKLCCIANSFERIFSFSLLLVISHIFVNTGSFLTFLLYLLETRGLASLKIELYSILGLFPLISTLLILISFCAKTGYLAKKFNTRIYQLMQEDKTRKISLNKKIKLHLIVRKEVVFTAFGLFKIDYTLLHSMLAAAVNYLMLLFQYGRPKGIKFIETPTTSAPSAGPTDI